MVKVQFDCDYSVLRDLADIQRRVLQVAQKETKRVAKDTRLRPSERAMTLARNASLEYALSSIIVACDAARKAGPSHG